MWRLQQKTGRMKQVREEIRDLAQELRREGLTADALERWRAGRDTDKLAIRKVGARHALAPPPEAETLLRPPAGARYAAVPGEEYPALKGLKRLNERGPADWSAGAIRLHPVNRNDEVREVEGHVRRDFGVWKKGPQQWEAIHLGTGMHLGLMDSKRRNVFAAAEALQDLYGAWDRLTLENYKTRLKSKSGRMHDLHEHVRGLRRALFDRRLDEWIGERRRAAATERASKTANLAQWGPWPQAVLDGAAAFFERHGQALKENLADHQRRQGAAEDEIEETAEVVGTAWLLDAVRAGEADTLSGGDLPDAGGALGAHLLEAGFETVIMRTPDLGALVWRAGASALARFGPQPELPLGEPARRLALAREPAAATLDLPLDLEAAVNPRGPEDAWAHARIRVINVDREIVEGDALVKGDFGVVRHGATELWQPVHLGTGLPLTAAGQVGREAALGIADALQRVPAGWSTLTLASLARARGDAVWGAVQDEVETLRQAVDAGRLDDWIEARSGTLHAPAPSLFAEDRAEVRFAAALDPTKPLNARGPRGEWEKRPVRLCTDTEPPAANREIETAYVRGDFAVHRSTQAGRRREWQVTHLGTGMGMGLYARRRATPSRLPRPYRASTALGVALPSTTRNGSRRRRAGARACGR